MTYVPIWCLQFNNMATNNKRKKIMAEKQKEFNDLPIEMFVEVFKYLDIDEIAFRYTEICIHWRENIALHILAPEIFVVECRSDF